jgi:hypothetical protein
VSFPIGLPRNWIIAPLNPITNNAASTGQDHLQARELALLLASEVHDVGVDSHDE